MDIFYKKPQKSTVFSKFYKSYKKKKNIQKYDILKHQLASACSKGNCAVFVIKNDFKGIIMIKNQLGAPARSFIQVFNAKKSLLKASWLKSSLIRNLLVFLCLESFLILILAIGGLLVLTLAQLQKVYSVRTCNRLLL